MHLILGGRYIPEKLLGQGGFGAAFLARDRYTPTMRTCVVKQFQPVGNLDDQQLALAQSLFEREAHVLEKIGNRHPQIPDLFAFFPLIMPNAQGTGMDQYFYLVQEYIEGEDLEQQLARQGKLPEAEVQEILTSMLEVLDFVHSEGTIHRDIKPSNIMRRKDGRLYLLDFGAVKEVAAGSVAAVGGAVQRSTGIYSPGYAPPEQMRGAQVYPATDLYALAVTCIVLLTGESPDLLFDGYSNSWQWRQFVSASVQAKNGLGDILDAMLATSPSDRPQSAKDVLTLLRGKQRQAQTQPPTPGQPTSTQIQQPTPATPNHPRTSKGKAGKSQPIAAAPNPGRKKQSYNGISNVANPATPVTPMPAPLPVVQPDPQGSILSSLLGAAFTGFQGTLLFFVVTGLLGGSLGIGVWGAAMGGMIFAIVRKAIEVKEMTFFAVITLIGSFFVVGGSDFLTVFVIAVIIAAALVAAIAIFTLIYRLLQKIF